MNKMRMCSPYCIAIFAVLVSSCTKKSENHHSIHPDSLLASNHEILTANLAKVIDKNASNDSLSKAMMFAFCDSSGKNLITTNTELSGGPYFAISHNGELIPLQFVGIQKESSRSNGRQTQSNFANTGGTLFRMNDSELIPDQTYAIVSDRFLAGHHPLRLQENAPNSLDRATLSILASQRRRKIIKSWNIASLGTIGKIFIVLFARNDTNQLASLVVANGNRFVFEDFVGDASQNESVWRVDDEGEFDYKSIKIIAAFQSSSGFELARAWSGSEGENSSFLQDSFSKYVATINSYRYWSPE